MTYRSFVLLTRSGARRPILALVDSAIVPPPLSPSIRSAMGADSSIPRVSDC
jgi:hypothetical protein